MGLLYQASVEDDEIKTKVYFLYFSIHIDINNKIVYIVITMRSV